MLASTTDPATPYPNALRIVEHATNAHLITHPGGPHVIFGRGNPCPDDLVTELLLEGTLPARETTCEPMGLDPYLPLPAAALTADLGALEAMAPPTTRSTTRPITGCGTASTRSRPAVSTAGG